MKLRFITFKMFLKKIYVHKHLQQWIWDPFLVIHQGNKGKGHAADFHHCQKMASESALGQKMQL